MISCEAMTPGDIKPQGKDVTVRYGFDTTPFGHALFGWTERGVCYLAFVNDDTDEKQQELEDSWINADFVEDNSGAEDLAAQILSTTASPRKLHLLLKGTNFQLKVWEALLKTEPGQLVSYGQLAESIQKPKTQRAVGSAVGANTLGFLIPCHRVIRESGVVGNYRWGTKRKVAIQVWEAGMTSTPPE